MKNIVPVTLSMPTELVALLDAACVNEDRTRSSFIRRILSEELRKRGETPPPALAGKVHVPSLPST